MKFLYSDIKISVNQLTLFIIIFQSIGIRFFSGIGFFTIIIIVFLNYKYVKRLPHILNFKSIILLFIYTIMSIYKEFNLNSLLFFTLLWFATSIVAYKYNIGKANFISDFKGVANIFCIYGTSSYLIITLFPNFISKVEYGMDYVSVFNIFLNSAQILTGNYYRISSLCWEPGCFQLLLSLYALILIYEKSNIKKIVWIILLLFLTGSTTGYISICILFFVYVINNKDKMIKIIPLFFVFTLTILPIILNNYEDKMRGDKMQSGIIRVRDFKVGIEMIKLNPLIGYNISKLPNDPYAQKLERSVWNSYDTYSTIDTTGYFAGGYTNGVLGIFLNWGIFLGFIIVLCFIKSPLINCYHKFFRYFFIVIFFTGMVSEPISYTTFFYLFSLSSLCIPSKLRYIKYGKA